MNYLYTQRSYYLNIQQYNYFYIQQNRTNYLYIQRNNCFHSQNYLYG